MNLKKLININNELMLERANYMLYSVLNTTIVYNKKTMFIN